MESRFRDRLASELEARRRRNPKYSLRAFAKFLGVDAGILSKILSGKRAPSMNLASRALDRLGVSAPEKRLFLKSLLSEKETVRLGEPPVLSHRKLDPLAFQVIKEPHHYAILELTFCEGFHSDPRWIAKRLGLKVSKARAAIRRLKQVGLLVEEEGRLAKADRHLTTSDPHVTTRALRDRYAAILKRAARALEGQPIARRSMTSLTLALDPERLELAKQMIQEFTDSLCVVLESGKRKEVYELAISLFSFEATTPR